MNKKFTKVGNSLAIVIDKPILKLLNINEKTNLKIRTDGKNIIIEPVSKGGKISKDKKCKNCMRNL